MNSRTPLIPAVVWVTLYTSVAFAQMENDMGEIAAEPVAPPAQEVAVAPPMVEMNTGSEEASDADEPIGLNVDFGVATHYNFRGLNVFANGSQQDTRPAFFPSVTKTIGDFGLYAGYWGAFQINGDNRGDAVAGTLGHEQDLYVGWDKSFGPSDMLTFSAMVTYFFYPFAENDDVALPSYLEPLVGFSVATVVDVGITVSYFIGLDDVTSPYSHLYIKPSVAKSFSFGEKLGLDLGFGIGFKAWSDGDTADLGNTVDVAFDVAVPIAVAGSFYVSPAISMVWTNLEGRADTGELDQNDEPFTRDYNAGDQGFILAAVNFGADF